MTEVGGRKPRKNTGIGKGKSKVIATGHRTAQQEAWLKRGIMGNEEGRGDAKRVRKNAGESQSTTNYAELKGMETYVVQGVQEVNQNEDVNDNMMITTVNEEAAGSDGRRLRRAP